MLARASDGLVEGRLPSGRVPIEADALDPFICINETRAGPPLRCSSGSDDGLRVKNEVRGAAPALAPRVGHKKEARGDTPGTREEIGPQEGAAESVAWADIRGSEPVRARAIHLRKVGVSPRPFALSVSEAAGRRRRHANKAEKQHSKRRAVSNDRRTSRIEPPPEPPCRLEADPGSEG